MPTGVSITATIENLSEENGKLCKEVDDLKRMLEVEENTRWKMEEENGQMQVSQAELQFQLQQLLGFVENLQVNISNYCRGMDQVVPLLPAGRIEKVRSRKHRPQINGEKQMASVFFLKSSVIVKLRTESELSASVVP